MKIRSKATFKHSTIMWKLPSLHSFILANSNCNRLRRAKSTIIYYSFMRSLRKHWLKCITLSYTYNIHNSIIEYIQIYSAKCTLILTHSSLLLWNKRFVNKVLGVFELLVFMEWGLLYLLVVDFIFLVFGIFAAVIDWLLDYSRGVLDCEDHNVLLDGTWDVEDFV